MKRTCILLLILMASITQLLAQESNETVFKMTLGDTIVWKPFNNCDMIGYKISGSKIISYKPIKYGDRIQVIAQQTGDCSIVATCSDNDTKAVAHITVEKPAEAPVIGKIEKPETQPFTANYSFTPPTDHFFITVTDPGNHCNETFVKVGDNEAYNDGHGLDRFWNIKTGKNWYYRPDAQGWTDDVDWEFEAFGESFSPINSFANEVNKDDLSQYYVGMEKVLDINCWKFFVNFDDGTVIQYWVDPANGCTLKRQLNADEPRVVTVYDLKYTKLYFGPSFKKSLHDTTR